VIEKVKADRARERKKERHEKMIKSRKGEEREGGL
jgi:hypothetical protein